MGFANYDRLTQDQGIPNSTLTLKSPNPAYNTIVKAIHSFGRRPGMGNPHDMRRLAETIVDSYELRLEIVSVLMKEAAEALQNLQAEQEAAIANLREDLAKKRSLRKRDFDAMIGGVFTRRGDREQEVAQALEEFRKGGAEIATELRTLLTGEGEVVSAQDFAHLKTDILARQEERKRKIVEVLREFHREQEELSTTLGKLLSKGESATVKDLKLMVRALKVQRQEREGEMGGVLKELERVDDEVAEEWQRVVATTFGQRWGLTAFPIARQESDVGGAGIVGLPSQAPVTTKRRNPKGKEG